MRPAAEHNGYTAKSQDQSLSDFSKCVTADHSFYVCVHQRSVFSGYYQLHEGVVVDRQLNLYFPENKYCWEHVASHLWVTWRKYQLSPDYVL